MLDGVNDGGVVSAAEFLADLDHRHLCNLTHDVHGDLARKGNICVALGGLDIFWGNAIGAADLFNDFADGDRRRLLVVYDVADGALCRADSGGGAFHKVDGVELFDRAFQLADVALELLCDEFADVVRHTEADKLGFALDDCHAGLKVRRLHIGGKAPLKAGLQTIFQGSDVARGTVAR